MKAKTKKKPGEVVAKTSPEWVKLIQVGDPTREKSWL